MENYIALIALFVAGYGLRRVPAFPAETSTALNLFVIYISLPALILYRVPTLRLSADALVPVAMPWAILALSAMMVLLLSWLFKWDRPSTGALLLLVPLGNTSFLGIPMVTNFFGPEQVSYALLYDQFGTFMALTTYGTYVLAAYGGTGKPTLRGVLIKIAAFPPFIALAVALMTSGIEYPPALVSALKTIAASLVPVVMVAIGFQLKLVIPRTYMAPLGWGLLLKLVASPLIAIAICRLMGIGSMAAKVSVFEAGMAPMVTAGALAIMGGLATELSAAMIGYGLVLAFVTLPLLRRLIEILM